MAGCVEIWSFGGAFSHCQLSASDSSAGWGRGARLGTLGGVPGGPSPSHSAPLSSLTRPEVAAISIPGNPHAICDQWSPDLPSQRLGLTVRRSQGGRKPGLVARVSASGVRQQQRGAGVCGGWKRAEGVSRNKAGVVTPGLGTMRVGRWARVHVEGGWALRRSQGRRGRRSCSRAARRPFPPGSGHRGSLPPLPPPPGLSGHPFWPDRLTH